MSVPNLDCMSDDELMAFWKRYHRPSRADAEALVGDRRKGFTLVAATCSAYAANRAAAQKCRRNGNIGGATSYDMICETLYRKLPIDIRW